MIKRFVAGIVLLGAVLVPVLGPTPWAAPPGAEAGSGCKGSENQPVWVGGPQQLLFGRAIRGAACANQWAWLQLYLQMGGELTPEQVGALKAMGCPILPSVNQ